MRFSKLNEGKQTLQKAQRQSMTPLHSAEMRRNVMKRTVGILCASFLLMQVGCARNFGNTRVEADVRIDDKAVDVTLDEAVAKVQKWLEKRGLEVAVNPDGDAVRVVCKAKSGDQFTVVLSRFSTASGKEQTRVKIEWGAKTDRALWLEMLVLLGASAAQSAH